MVVLTAPRLESVPLDAVSYPRKVGDHVRRAIEFAHRGDLSDALREMDAALASHGDDPLLLEGKGLLLLMLQRPLEALAVFDAAVSAGGDNATLHTGRAVALYALKRLNESVAAFNRSLTLRHDENVLSMKRAALDELLWKLVGEGFASWSGGKPKGSKRPIKVTPGPPISDYIIEDRERLRN